MIVNLEIEDKEETILDYYLNRARQLRMLYYKTGKKKYSTMAYRIAAEGRKEFERIEKNGTQNLLS